MSSAAEAEGRAWRAWLLAAAGPLAWIAQEVVGATVVTRMCQRHTTTSATTLHIIVSVLALLVAGGAAFLSFTRVRASGDAAEPEASGSAILGFVALAAALLSFLGLVWALLPGLLVSPCEGWR